MASKFGGRQAAENHWVMQQNLARHKSVLAYTPKARQPKPKLAPAAKPVPPVDASIEPPQTSDP